VNDRSKAIYLSNKLRFPSLAVAIAASLQADDETGEEYRLKQGGTLQRSLPLMP